MGGVTEEIWAGGTDVRDAETDEGPGTVEALVVDILGGRKRVRVNEREGRQAPQECKTKTRGS